MIKVAVLDDYQSAFNEIIDVEKFNPPSREYEKFPFPPVTMISITPSPSMHVSRLELTIICIESLHGEGMIELWALADTENFNNKNDKIPKNNMFEFRYLRNNI